MPTAVFVVPRVDIGRNRRYGTYGCIKVAFAVHLAEGTLLLCQREGVDIHVAGNPLPYPRGRVGVKVHRVGE